MCLRIMRPATGSTHHLMRSQLTGREYKLVPTRVGRILRAPDSLPQRAGPLHANELLATYPSQLVPQQLERRHQPQRLDVFVAATGPCTANAGQPGLFLTDIQ
jgi:hypothetical protein